MSRVTRCNHCQGRRDERARMLASLRSMRDKTVYMLTVYDKMRSAGQEEDQTPELSRAHDILWTHPELVSSVNVIRDVVNVLMNIMRETPINGDPTHDCGTIASSTGTIH